MEGKTLHQKKKDDDSIYYHGLELNPQYLSYIRTVITAFQRGCVPRAVSLGRFIVVRTSWSALAQSSGLARRPQAPSPYSTSLYKTAQDQMEHKRT